MAGQIYKKTDLGQKHFSLARNKNKKKSHKAYSSRKSDIKPILNGSEDKKVELTGQRERERFVWCFCQGPLIQRWKYSVRHQEITSPADSP